MNAPDPLHWALNCFSAFHTIWVCVAKIASHAIFQYIVLAIDDTHNTWTNMIVKMIILRLLGLSDDKEKIGKVRPEGPPLRGFRYPERTGVEGEPPLAGLRAAP